MVRAIAEAIVLMADFTLDEVADVRLAVDEVASTLIVRAVDGAALRSEYIVDDTGIKVRMSTTAAQEGMPEENSFGWHVLRTLTDSIVAGQEPYDEQASGYPTVVEFSRVRGSGSVG